MLKSLFLLAMVGCSHQVFQRDPAASLTWRQYVQQEVIHPKGLASLFTDVKFLGPFRIDSDIVMAHKPPGPQELGRTELRCHNETLYPTHPQENTKEYMYGDSATYDYSHLPATSSACVTPNLSKKFCLRGTSAHLVVISDLYQDTCGNTYRGYWLVSYLKSDESMGTLLSKGRTIYQKPNAEFAGEFITGDTYKVQSKDFLFLGTPWKNDRLLIKKAQDEAIRQGYKLNQRLFKNVSSH
jgi:hypothetical protein